MICLHFQVFLWFLTHINMKMIVSMFTTVRTLRVKQPHKESGKNVSNQFDLSPHVHHLLMQVYQLLLG